MARLGGLPAYATSMLLVIIVALSPVAVAAGPGGHHGHRVVEGLQGLHVEVTITPHGYTVTGRVNATASPSAEIEALDGHVSYHYDNKTCTTKLEGSLHVKSGKLEGSRISLAARGTGDLRAVKGHLIFKSKNHIDESIYTNTSKAVLDIHIGLNSTSEGAYSIPDKKGSMERDFNTTIHLEAANESQELIVVNANLTGSIEEYRLVNTSIANVGVEGPVSLLIPVSGRPIKADFYLMSRSTVNATRLTANVTHVKLVDYTTMTFKDAAVATGFYLLLSNLVTSLNLTKYVQVSLTTTMSNATVTIKVNYEGNISPSSLGKLESKIKIGSMGGQELPLKGLSGRLGALLGGFSSLEEASRLPSNITGVLSVYYDVKAHASQGVLDASVKAEAKAAGDFCKSNYTLTTLEAEVHYSNSTKTIHLEFTVAGRSAEPYTPTISVASILHSLLERFKGNVSNAVIVVKSADGVSLEAAGVKARRLVFTLANYTSLESLAAEYRGVAARMAGNLLEIASSKSKLSIKLPPLAAAAKGLVVRGPLAANITLPFHGVLHREFRVKVFNSIAQGVGLLIHKGSKVGRSLHIATLPPDEVKIPPTIKAHKAGPALELEGVEGVVTVILPYKSEYPGQPAVLVVHTNGSVEVVTKVVVKDGYIEANVSASSVFAPITLSQAGGGGGATTTSSTTSTSTTTTKTTTTTHTTTTTTTKTTTTGTTSETTSTMKTTTSTTATTTRTSTTQHTSTSKPSQGTTTTTPTTTSTTTKSRKTGLAAAAVIVVVIIIAAAAALARRR